MKLPITQFLWIAMVMIGNLSVQGQFTLHNNAQNIGDDCYRLTQAQPSQRGAIWKTGLFDANESWEMQAEVLFGGNNSGADGMAFVLKAPSSGFIGGLGGLMGFGGFFGAPAI